MGPSFNTHLPRSPSLLSANHVARPLGASSSPLKRPGSPNMNEDSSPSSHPANGHDQGPRSRRQQSLLRDLYARSERMVNKLFINAAEKKLDSPLVEESDNIPSISTPEPHIAAKAASKPKARAIDEDDYGDDEEEEEEERPSTPTRREEKKTDASNPRTASVDAAAPIESSHLAPLSSEAGKNSEEVRKRLEEEKKAAEQAAIESSQSLFYTLEHDRDAMLEQQKLDELDRQVETEMSGQGSGSGDNGNGTSANSAQQGTLSSANLGASSLTLKHLIKRIDQYRHLVKATDAQLKTLMNEVRKNRSKWASEEKIGQEELYEAAEKVLFELKAMTEWAGPFLQKVNKRDAPDYYHIIKHPMDIGTMLKKLKQYQYTSKKQFCDDLDLIWANCLKYNATPDHFLRKKAEHMRRETARLAPLIPDIVVRDRAEVEAEERRLQHDFEDGEDSEDEPLMSTRGRKAPGKSSKKGTSTARKAMPAEDAGNSTPGPEGKPLNSAVNAGSTLKNEHLRLDGDLLDDSHQGFYTPPGNLTPTIGSAAPASHADPSELEAMDQTLSGIASAPTDEMYQEDEEYQTWKQVTKKDRARVAAERHRLFQGNCINPEEPALLRTKAGMRRWLRKQKAKDSPQIPTQDGENAIDKAAEENEGGTTLEEGLDVDNDDVLPDYYDPLSAIPHIDERLSWTEDNEGYVVDQRVEFLRLVQGSQFVAPASSLTKRINNNMRQMQDTRKVVAKINIVKQMQVQAQTYQNQFQKYDPEPFREADVGPIVASDDGPIMAPSTCRQAFQRSIAKLFYHAGFEDCQPSALETITDFASDYFTQLVQTLKTYTETPKVYDDATLVQSSAVAEKRPLKSRFTPEEALMQTLHHFNHDLDALDTYITDDVDRLASRLDSHHARTKDYLAEILRPALDPATVGTDGAGAFQDGSEQFVGGDFAEDIDEDFFGFKELGLDLEFGLQNLSVPLHLLQSRVHNAYQPALASSSAGTGQLMEEPPKYPAITVENVDKQIGLVQDFFRNRLGANDDEPLVEDEDLPLKQRYPKPRLGPTGKITSPRKRPLREQQMMARKKRRLEIEAEKEREREATNPQSGAGEDAAKNSGTQSTDKDVATSGSTELAKASTGDSSEELTIKDNAEISTEATSMVNGENTEPTVHDSGELTAPLMVNGDVHVNGTETSSGSATADVSTIETLAQTDASDLKVDVNNPPQRLEPTPTINGIKSGDPEKKKKSPQPPDGQVNGDRNVESNAEPKAADAQLKPDKENKDSAAVPKSSTTDATEKSATGNGKLESNVQGNDGDEDDDVEVNADGDSKDADGDQDQDKDHEREKNGMLSPESLPIAAH